jgi:hypothetical protein
MPKLKEPKFGLINFWGKLNDTVFQYLHIYSEFSQR